MFDASQVDAVLFDIDGTLADSDDDLVDRVARRLSALRCPNSQLVARRLVMAFETPTNSAITLLDRFGFGQPKELPASPSRRGEARSPRSRDRLVPGVSETVRAIAEHYPLAIVTTRSRRSAEAFLLQHQLSTYFRVRVTRGSTIRIKPDAAPIRRAARGLSVEVRRCLMVGDTTPDIRAARRAGALAVGVLCGYGRREELERAGAHAILESTARLPDLLLQSQPEAGVGMPSGGAARTIGAEANG